MWQPEWSPAQLTAWCTALQRGEIVAAPAEGVYGYCGDPLNPATVAAIRQRKQRPAHKIGFICLLADFHQLEQICPGLSPELLAACHTYWAPTYPDPVTLILPTTLRTGAQSHPAEYPETLPPPTASPVCTPTLAVRLSTHPGVQAYLRAVGQPIISTSLNVSGEPPALTAAALPTDVPTLRADRPLAGTPSRLYNPTTNEWLR